MADITSEAQQAPFSRQRTWRVPKAVAVALLAICILVMPQLKYAALHASFYDLGQYATVLDALAFGGEAGQALQGHAHLLAPAYALVYRVIPSPATLLALQSLILVATAALAARIFRQTGAGMGLDGALLYLLSISVWFGALFEFHFEHLLLPLFFGAFLASRAEGKRAKLAALGLGVLLCLVKETYALMAAGFGLYLIAGRRWYVAGGVLVLFGMLYFTAVTGKVIPHFTEGRTAGTIWNSAFGHLGGGGIGGMLLSAATNPLETAALILQPRKILYVAALGGAFAFVWIRCPLVLLAAAPVLGISLLSQNANHFYLGNQYTVGVTAPLFAASALALGLFDERRRRWLLRAMMASSLCALVLFGPSPLSRLFLQDTTFAYGASAYRTSPRDLRIVETIDRIIPQDRDVAVSTQNNIVTDRLAGRRALMAFPAGVFKPYRLLAPRDEGMISAVASAFVASEPAPTEPLMADWIVLDLRRPLDLADSGCDFRDGLCRDTAAAARFAEMVSRLAPTFGTVFNEDDFMILHRR